MGRWVLLLGAVVVMVGATLEEGEAKEHLVGDQMGWTSYDKRSFKAPNYKAWATSQKVVVGDQIVFKYARGMHNVNLLPNQAAYESCDFSKARLLDAGESGLFVWHASSIGMYYFGCNKEVEEEGNHCGSGQKLSVLVVAYSSSSSSSWAMQVRGAEPSTPPGALSLQNSRAELQLVPAPFSTCLLMAFPVLMFSANCM